MRSGLVASGLLCLSSGVDGRTQQAAFFGMFAAKPAPVAAPTAAPPTFTPSGGPGLPQIYQGWFNKEILNQATAATQAALKDGIPKQELIMPPLPNMEELDFGTSLNQRFTKELFTRLKVEDYLVKRSPTSFANLDFANRMSEGLKKNTYIIGFDGAIFEQQAAMSRFARVATVSSGYEEATPNDVLVVLSPGVEEHWTRAAQIQAKTKVPTLALAPPFSLRYDIGNGKGWEVTYCLKRITRGWLFRAYPGNWKAYLERPDGKFELLMEWEKQPRLNEVSKLLRGENDRRYGPGGNDRYMTQRL